MRLQGQPQIRGMTCSTDAYGVHADFRLHNKPVNAMWEFSKVWTHRFRLLPWQPCICTATWRMVSRLAPGPYLRSLAKHAMLQQRCRS